jgi:hypothetical protein
MRSRLNPNRGQSLFRACLLGVGLLACCSSSWGQRIDRGPVNDRLVPFIPPIDYSGLMPLSCGPGSPDPTGVDQYVVDFGYVAPLGPGASSPLAFPSFTTPNYFNTAHTVMTNPGRGYLDFNPAAATFANSYRQIGNIGVGPFAPHSIFNSPGFSTLVQHAADAPFGRLVNGEADLSGRDITVRLTDDKNTPTGYDGGSVAIATTQQTYTRTATPGPWTLGGSFSFDFSLPTPASAAAVGLYSQIVTDFADPHLFNLVEPECVPVASLVGAVSGGSSPYGNATFGRMDPYLPSVTGGTQITQYNATDFHISGTWVSPPIGAAAPPGTKYTVYHTLTAILDPGAQINSVAMPLDDYALLPHADTWTFATGTLVPEPSTWALAAIGLASCSWYAARRASRARRSRATHSTA